MPSCTSCVTTMMCAAGLFFPPPRSEPPKATAAMMAGRRTVITIKLLVRMRSRYSRRAMSQMLRIDCASCGDALLPGVGVEVGVVGSYGVDEDLFKGWFHEFEL